MTADSRFVTFACARTAFLIASALVLFISNATPLIAAESPDGIWLDIDPQEADARAFGAERFIVPQRYRTVLVDWDALDSVLERTPLELSPEARNVEAILTLPLPDGSFGRFRIEESPIMDADLAVTHPGVKTYRAVGVDDPSAFGRFDTTPTGFHAMFLSDSGTVFIDPYARGDVDTYIVYDTRDYLLPADQLPVCRVGSEEGVPLSRPSLLERPEELRFWPPAVTTNGATFKEINLAVAGTAEYTLFHGGPLGAVAAITTTINRVNVVYEHDLAIRMNLGHILVYTDPATDPYSNVCTSAELTANQTNLDTQVGAANYDLGHVMGGPGGGGGLAGVGPCLNPAPGFGNLHARGCTGLDTPIGDPFDIDFVAHEIGHQWGAPHTFNGTTGSCAGNREPSAAYEPGSGATIMAYAGICSSQNLQSNSDDYFHGSSLETIAGYDPTAYGALQCIQMTASGNTPPTADAGLDYEIPKDTPFTLCGTGTDPDAGDNLTYLWEQYDLGPAGPPNNPNQAPFFRSFDPTASDCRTFPKLSDILNNTQTNGEILPNVAWPMTFRLTVFDNHPGAVGGGFDQDETDVTVVGTSGPFEITAPNTAVTWTGNTTQNVTWDVAGTASVPISCANVDILFSSDGGNTFPTTVLAAVANDGFQPITVPNIPTTTARLKVACSSNVFFDINDADFIVTAGACLPDDFEPDDLNTQANGIGSGIPQAHNICPIGDEDWVTFTLAEESGITLETSGPSGDTRMWLYDSGLTQIEYNDDGGAGLFSFIDRTCGVDALPAGFYYVQVDEFGDNHEIASYQIAYDVIEICCIDDLVLDNDTITGTQTYQAGNTVTLGPNLNVDGTSIVVEAGTSVIFSNDTEIGGTFTAGTDPGLACP